jgi:aspartate carbamoyltransferase catalytic subunit
MLRHKGTLHGLKVVVTGDVLHSRVARSNIWGLTKMGAEVVVNGPATMMPVAIEEIGAKVEPNIKNAVKDADVIMGLRIQLERQKNGLFPTIREYSKFFCVNEETLSYAAKDCLIMHPGPVNRGVEMTSMLIDGDSSVIEEQVTSGVAVRMAILYILTR